MGLLIWVLHSACNVLGYPTTSSTSPSSVRSEEHRATLHIPTDDEVMIKRTTTALKKAGIDSSGHCEFRMPLHYPRYTRSDYENMEEWKVDCLLYDYGLSFTGSVAEKREFAMGTFLWPDQY